MVITYLTENNDINHTFRKIPTTFLAVNRCEK